MGEESIDNSLSKDRKQVLSDSTFIRRFENIIIENRQVLASNMFARQFITNLIFCRTGETKEGQLQDDKQCYVACDPSLEYDNLTQCEQLLAKNPDNATTYELYRMRVPLDLSNGSPLSCTLFEMISKLSDADITGVYSPLIYYKWELLFNNCLA